jgi:hypothetical protein
MNYIPFTYFNSNINISNIQLNYVGSTYSLTQALLFNFPNMTLGSDGLYVLNIQAETQQTNRVISTVKVGGLTFSQAYQLTTPLNSTSTIGGLYYLRQDNTTGPLTGTLSVAFNNTQISRCFVGIYRINNNSSDTPYQGKTASAISGTGLSMSFTSLPSNSVIISLQTNGLDTAGPITWTNATSVYDLSLGTGTTRVTGASSSVAGGGNLTISTSHTNSTQPIVLLGAAWS